MPPVSQDWLWARLQHLDDCSGLLTDLAGVGARNPVHVAQRGLADLVTTLAPELLAIWWQYEDHAPLLALVLQSPGFFGCSHCQRNVPPPPLCVPHPTHYYPLPTTIPFSGLFVCGSIPQPLHLSRSPGGLIGCASEDTLGHTGSQEGLVHDDGRCRSSVVEIRGRPRL
jgi:hypothetical protein